MDKWRYDPEKAWVAMAAISETLNTYLDKYIIEQFGFDQNAEYADDIQRLGQEIEIVMSHIERIRSKM